MLSIVNREFSFPSVSSECSKHKGNSLRGSIQVSVLITDENANSAIQVRPYTIGRTSSDPATVPTLPYPIQLRAISQIEYFDVPQGFSLMGLIKQNKMILFMAGGLAFAVGMPKLLVRTI